MMFIVDLGYKLKNELLRIFKRTQVINFGLGFFYILMMVHRSCLILLVLFCGF
jgi:hypothetical protein